MKAKDFRKMCIEADSIIWACAYRLQSNKEGKRFFQKPVKGMLMLGDTQSAHNYRHKRGETDPRYFVPFKKGDSELAWSKCVSVDAREYALTEKECIELYNSIINKYIDDYTEAIEEMRKNLV